MNTATLRQVTLAATAVGVTFAVESRSRYDCQVCLRAPAGMRFSEGHTAIESGDTMGEMWWYALAAIKVGLYPCTASDDCECVPR